MSAANFLFGSLLVMGPVISLSSSNWLICWAGLELGFLGLIPMLFAGNSFLSTNKEASLKYFCVQSLGSALLLISGLLYFSGWFPGGLSASVFILSLCLKLGIFPGHFWVPAVVSGLEWFPCLLVLTVQKIAPLAIMVKFVGGMPCNMQEFVLVLGAVSSVFGGTMGNNQTDFRAVIGASSITHTGWLAMGCMCGGVWFYFLIYCIVLSFVIANMSVSLGYGWTTLGCLGLLSLSGVPPFIMFLGKWMVLKCAIETGVSPVLLLVYLGGALLSLNFYLNLCYSIYLTLLYYPGEQGYFWTIGGICFVFINLLGVYLILGL